MEILQGEIGRDLFLSDFQNKESVLINSPGGSLIEGLGMYDIVLNSGMEIGVIGVAASAATLPLIASEKRWGTPNSRYLIHNPWNMEIGDAESMQKTANELKIEQDRALDLYVKHLNGTAESIQALMNQERIIDANEALQLGLIKEIRNFNEDAEQVEGSDIKNMFNKFKMKYKMEEKGKSELASIKEMIVELSTSVKSLFVKSPKNILIQDVNGVEIDFPEVETEEQITVGSTAVIEGSPANGDYIIASGETYVFESGNLIEIKEPVAEDVEAIKQENEDLTVENQLLTDEIKNLKTERQEIELKLEIKLEEITKKFNDFQNKFSNEKPSIDVPSTEEKKEEKRVTFNFNKKNN